MKKQQFSKDVLTIDPEKEVEKITKQLRSFLTNQLKRRGLIVALSGGIDSSLGPDRILALLMPERHSSDDTLDLSTIVADHFGVEKIHEDISGILESVGFYNRYDDAVRMVIPEYGDGWKSKIVTPNVTHTKRYRNKRL